MYPCPKCLINLPSIQELKAHHKTDFHIFNLKRSLNGFHPVSQQLFNERAAALQKLHEEDEKAAQDAIRQQELAAEVTRENSLRNHGLQGKSYKLHYSLFDDKILSSSAEALDYMKKKYSFSIPAEEYLRDKNGLLRYLGLKLWKGHACLSCKMRFSSLQGVRHHMIDKGHTEIGDRDEIAEFYDFLPSYSKLFPDNPVSIEDFRYTEPPLKHSKEADDWSDTLLDEDDAEELNKESIEIGSEEWDDDESDDSSMDGLDTQPDSLQNRFDPDEFFARRELRRCTVTADHHLILPNGKEVPHRSVAYVYKQNFRNLFGRNSAALASIKEDKEAQEEEKKIKLSKKKYAFPDGELKSHTRLREALWKMQKQTLRCGIQMNKVPRVAKRSDINF